MSYGLSDETVARIQAVLARFEAVEEAILMARAPWARSAKAPISI